MTAPTRLTAYAPLAKLVAELARLGWGDLAGPEWGAVRAILTGLAGSHHINPNSAAGKITTMQVARLAGISRRWTTDRLRALEAAGVIELDRGGLSLDGTPTPSYVRVSKQALCELIGTARVIRDAADRLLWAAARKRMAKLHNLRAVALAHAQKRRDERLRRSLRYEVGAALSPLKRDSHPLAAVPRAARAWELLDTCVHDSIVGMCGACRRDQRTPATPVALTKGVAG